MKYLLLFVLFGLSCFVVADNFPLDLTVGGNYIATGNFRSNAVFVDNPFVPDDTPFGPTSNTPTVWIANPSNDRYFQDLGTGGKFWYLPNDGFVVRNGLCFRITNYNSSVFRKVLTRTRSFTFDNRPDNRTFFGVYASTCQTSLGQVFKLRNNGMIEEWLFDQKTALQIPAGVDPNLPNGINTCLQVKGHLEFDDFERYNRPNDVLPFPEPPSECYTTPLDYCNTYYFPPGNLCNYETFRY